MPLLTLVPHIPSRFCDQRLGLVAFLVVLGASTAACSGTEVSPGSSGGSGGSSAGVSGGGAAGSPVVGGGGSGGAGGTVTAGAGGGGTGGQATGGGPPEPTFATFKSIIPTSCFGGLCHNLAENPLQLTVDDKLYTTLTTHMTETCGVVVKPGSPQDSALVKLLKGPCNGTDRMPYGKCFEDGDEGCVPPDYIAAIEKWIANGAPQQ